LPRPAKAVRVLVGGAHGVHARHAFAEDAERDVEEVRVGLVDAIAVALVLALLDAREHVGVARRDEIGPKQVLASRDDAREERRRVDVHVLVELGEVGRKIGIDPREEETVDEEVADVLVRGRRLEVGMDRQLQILWTAHMDTPCPDATSYAPEGGNCMCHAIGFCTAGRPITVRYYSSEPTMFQEVPAVLRAAGPRWVFAPRPPR
jgi:hypothetical protein